MALFVDGPACTIDDLIDQDSGLLAVAQGTGINVSSKLRMAQEEIKTDLQLWLSKPTRIEQVVVTAPLKNWETMHALAMVYRDAYFSQLVDRYQAKWLEFSKLARAASDKFVVTGVGLVSDPIRRSQPPVLASITGPQGGGTFYASVAWVNAAGQEGETSVASSATIPDGNLMTVAAVNPPANAVGFRVYAGPTLEAMFQQNDIVLPTSLTYTYIPGAITQGPLPGEGQTPDFVRPLARTLMRG